MPLSLLMKWLRLKFIRNVISSYLGFGVDFLVVLFLTPFIIHHLGSFHYGIWVLLTTLLTYFQLLELGIMPALIRYVSRHKAKNELAETEAVIGAALVLLSALSILILPTVWLVAKYSPFLFNLDDTQHALFHDSLWVVGGAAIVSFYKRLFHAVHEGYQRFDLLNLCRASGAVLGATATVAALLNGYGITTLAVILMGQLIYETIFEVSVVRFIFGLRINPFLLTRTSLRKIWGFSFYAFLADIAITISHRIDTIVIGIFLPLNAVAYYAIGVKIPNVLEKITYPLIGIFFPLSSHLHASGDAESSKKLLIDGTKITALLIIPGEIIVFWYSSDIVRWWVGEEFVAHAVPVVTIFLITIFSAVFESTASNMLLGTGNVRFDAMVSCSAAFINIVLSLLLVKSFGIIGVAVGTLVPIIISNFFFSVPFTCRVIGISYSSLLSHALTPCVTIVLLSVVTLAATDPFLTNRIVACIFHAVVVVVITAIVMRPHFDWRQYRELAARS